VTAADGRAATGTASRGRLLIVVSDLLVYRAAAIQPTQIERRADSCAFRVATAILTVDGN
jgi:hypothetical protein